MENQLTIKLFEEYVTGKDVKEIANECEIHVATVYDYIGRAKENEQFSGKAKLLFDKIVEVALKLLNERKEDINTFIEKFTSGAITQ